MRPFIVLAVLTLVACRSSAQQVAVRTPAHTVDDRVEMTFECTRARRVTRCEGFGRECPVETQVTPTPCPPHTLTMRGDDGTVVATTLPADGEVSAAVAGPGAPPVEWAVEADGVPLGRTETRSYRWTLVTLDVLTISGLYLGLRSMSNEGDDAFESFFDPVTGPYFLVGAAALYALGAPIAHAAHGNRDQAWWSLARRVAIPVVLTPWMVASTEGSVQPNEERDFRYGVTALLTILTAPVWMIWDYYRGEVTTGLLVAPMVTADGDRAVFGFASRF